MPPQATRRVVTMTIDEGFATQEDLLNNHVTTAPGLEPINVVPKKIAERHTRLMGEIYAGMAGRERWLDPETRLRKQIPGFLHGYLPPTRSGLFLYDRLDLHDPDRLPDKRSPTTAFIGHTRLGMPAYRPGQPADHQHHLGADHHQRHRHQHHAAGHCRRGGRCGAKRRE
jgi:hypothetical protein